MAADKKAEFSSANGSYSSRSVIIRIWPLLILLPPLEVLGHAANQFWLSPSRGGGPLEQPRLAINLHVMKRVVGVLVEDLVTLHICERCIRGVLFSRRGWRESRMVG